MKTCEDFEVALEMRLHGALDGDGEAELQLHLAGCESCRAFEALGKKTEKTMNARAEAHAATIDWDVAGTRHLKNYQWYGVGTLVFMALAFRFFMTTREYLVWCAFGVVLGPLLIWYQSRVRAAKAAKLSRDSGELLARYRKDVKLRLLLTKLSLWSTPLVFVLSFVTRAQRGLSTSDWMSFFLFTVVVAAVFVFEQVWLRRRFKRELEALDPK